MYVIKCTILGETSVGKTSILKSYTNNNFSENEEVTLGATFWNKKLEINDVKIDIHFWDTAGQERYKSLVPMYIRNTDIIILVYNVNDKSTFLKLNDWISLVKVHLYQNLPKIILVGNKCDLENKVSIEECNDLAESIHSDSFLVSAKTQKNIEILFNNIVEKSKIIVKSKFKKPLNLEILDPVHLNQAKCCQIL
jgi:small GTP-binding protein